MRWAEYVACMGDKKCVQIFWFKILNGDQLEDLGLCGRVVIQWMFTNYGGRFQVLTVTTNMKMIVFWAVVSCSLINSDRRFRAAYYLHHQ
jgi:predicted acetyltransferase